MSYKCVAQSLQDGVISNERPPPTLLGWPPHPCITTVLGNPTDGAGSDAVPDGVAASLTYQMSQPCTVVCHGVSSPQGRAAGWVTSSLNLRYRCDLDSYEQCTSCCHAPSLQVLSQQSWATPRVAASQMVPAAMPFCRMCCCQSDNSNWCCCSS
jgi:hypothetical protein